MFRALHICERRHDYSNFPRVRPARILHEKPFRIHSRQDLLERVWKWSYGDLSTVTVHVRRLRKRLGNYSRIETVWGRGYRWIPGPPVPQVAASSDERLAGPRH
ncbi:hypothetical protein GS928_26205 [Rhodococcus hoagii]|nr:hypothetical protein [Prescottella equi]